MVAGWMSAPTLASFLGSLVECVEALTVVLAVGSVRGWRVALSGAATAVAVLATAVWLLGTPLAHVPIRWVQIAFGALLLVFGLRWLRKAILRAAGVLALRDEQAAFTRNVAAMREAAPVASSWDKAAFATAFNITMVEGAEVVFIVVAVGAGSRAALQQASAGALVALLLVVALGVALHKPLSRVPENTLKFAVGVLLSAFGTFWLGEGAGLGWWRGDFSLLVLVGAYGLGAVSLVAWRRHLHLRAG